MSKEIKQVHNTLREQWGFTGELNYAFLKNSKDNLYIVTKDIVKVDWTKLRMTSVGMYFGEQHKGLRLSIEGSQLVGPLATKNVVDITREQAMLWLKGEDLDVAKGLHGYVLVRYENDYLGCGSVRDGVVMNFVPKIRRLPPNA